MRLSLLSILFTFLLLSCSGDNQNSGKSEKYQQGLTQLDNKNFTGADSTFNAIVAGDSTNLWGRLGQGLTFERQYQFYDALRIYMELIEGSPDFVPAYAGIVRCMRWLDLTDEERHYSKIMSDLNSIEVADNVLLTRVFIEQRQFDDAGRVLALAVSGGLEKYRKDILEARLFAAQYNWEKAASRMADVHPDTVMTPSDLNDIAAYYEEIGQLDSCFYYSRKIVDTGQLDFGAVTDHYFRCLRHKHFYDMRQLFKVMSEAGYSEIAINPLEQWYYRDFVDYHLANVRSTWYFLKLPRNMSAYMYDIVAKGNILDKATIDNNIKMSMMIVERGNYPQNFKDFIFYRNTRNYVLSVDYSRVAIQLKDITNWRKDTRNFAMLNASVFHNRGGFEQFDSVMNEYESKHQDNPYWLTGLGDVCSEKLIHRYGEAEDYYRDALEKDKWYRPAFVHMYRVFMREEMYGKALKVFDDYAHFLDQYPEDAVYKAVCLVQAKQYDDGLKLLKEKAGLVLGNMEPYLEIFKTLYYKNRNNDIDDVLDLMLKLNPNNPDAYTLAASTSFDNKDYKKTLKYAEKALEIEPDFVDAQMFQAAGLFWTGKKDKAYEQFEQLEKDHPYNRAIKLFYSMALIEDGKDMQKTVNKARGAVNYNKYYLKSIMNVCQYYYKVKKYGYSRREAEGSLLLFDEFPEPHFYIGASAFHEGKKDKAREELQKAIRLGLKDDQLKEARQILNQLKS